MERHEIKLNNGHIRNFDEVAQQMNQELFEELNDKIFHVSDQHFYEEYCQLHRDSFDTEFIVK